MFDPEKLGLEAPVPDINLDSIPFVPALRLLLKINDGKWPAANQVKGARDLLQELESLPGGPEFKTQPGWPRHGTALGKDLVRLAPTMRRSGIHVHTAHRQMTGAKVKPITIEIIPPATTSDRHDAGADQNGEPATLPEVVSLPTIEGPKGQQGAAQAYAESGPDWERFFEEYLNS
jgi:hypothetical protein